MKIIRVGHVFFVFAQGRFLGDLRMVFFLLLWACNIAIVSIVSIWDRLTHSVAVKGPAS